MIVVISKKAVVIVDQKGENEQTDAVAMYVYTYLMKVIEYTE